MAVWAGVERARTILFGFVLALLCAKAGAQSEWTWRNPLPQGNHLHSVAWTGSRWVAVGNTGTVLTSPDAVSWTLRQSGTRSDLFAVVWNGSGLLALGGDGEVLHSADGVAWTQSQAQNASWTGGLDWNGSQYAAVAGTDELLVSTDGKTWTSRILRGPGFLRWVTWAGNQWVAVGFKGTVFTSPDAVTWTPRTLPESSDLSYVTWAGGRLLAVESGQYILVSTDGITWQKKLAPSLPNSVYSIAWTGSKYVAVGWGNHHATSPDGLAWTAGTGYLQGHQVRWGDGKLVVVGEFGSIATSPDGSAWTPASSGPTEYLWDILWTGRNLVAVGADGWQRSLTSPDGITWKVGNAPNSLNALTQSGDRVASIGGSTTLYTSEDGLTWNGVAGLKGTGMRSLAWTGSRFVAVGDSGAISFSTLAPDSISFTRAVSVSRHDLNEVVWTGKVLVAVGDTGDILTSPNGVAWKKQNIGAVANFVSAVWTGKSVYAVAENGLLITSVNGVDWSIVPTTIEMKPVRRMYWLDGRLGVLGTSEFCIASGETTWEVHAFPVTVIQAMAWIGDKFVAAGLNGAILTSPKDLPSGAKIASPLSQRLDGPGILRIPARGNWPWGPLNKPLYSIQGRRVVLKAPLTSGALPTTPPAGVYLIPSQPH